MNKIRVIFAWVIGTISLTYCEDKVGFVYELVRHGARAPILSGEQQFFKVPLEQLTESGMRQRYMFGRYNRQRYIPALLDEVYNPSQLYVQSTPVLRTLQSGYGQLMGLYPPLENQRNSKSSNGNGQPMLKIRRKKLQGGDPFNSKYQQIPIFSYLGEKNPNDDLDYGGCPYTSSYDAAHWDNNNTFSDVRSYIMPVLSKPVSQAFNIPLQNFESISYPDLYNYCDALYAENFQGVKPRFPFTEDQWYYVRSTNLYMVQVPQDDKGRTLFITKMLRKPLETMNDRVQQILQGDNSRNTLRYIIHSAHDFQIAQFLVWIQSVGYEYVDIPYSSSIVFELHYDDECLSSGPKDNSCFWVQVLSNNQPLRLSTCLDANQKAGRKSLKCQLDDFLKHIQKISYQADVMKGCAEIWKPTQEI